MGGWGQIWVCVWLLCLDLSFLGLLKMDCWVCVCILADVWVCVWLTRNGKKMLENLGSVHNHQQPTIKLISSKPKRFKIPTRKPKNSSIIKSQRPKIPKPNLKIQPSNKLILLTSNNPIRLPLDQNEKLCE